VHLWTSKTQIYIPKVKKRNLEDKTFQHFRYFVVQQFIEISDTERQNTLTNCWNAAEE